jgi:hypothetical protein
MGTELEISDRPGEVLQVICTEPPYVPDHLSWADSISITFQTMEKPFWEKKTPETLTLESGTTGSGELYVPGNIEEAVVEVEAAPASGTLANITLTVGDTSITLNGINATAEAPLRITYDRRGIQSIKRGTTSVMDKRTAASADDLLAKCGAVSAVSFSASASALARAFSILSDLAARMASINCGFFLSCWSVALAASWWLSFLE